MRLSKFFLKPFPPGKKISHARKICIRFLSRIFITGISFILLFGIPCIIFPLPDKIAYSTTILDVQGQVIHAYLTPDLHEPEWV